MAVLTDFVASRSASSLLLLLIVVYYLGVALYRLYFSPLAKFPGPKLAALTYWIEFYYDVVRRGQYVFEIIKMHEKYGPIVRITPVELHISDPDYFEEVYPTSHKQTEKSPAASGAFGNSLSVISTVPHKLHRLRRGALNRFFSKNVVIQYAALIQDPVDALCARLEEFQATKNPLDLCVAFSALTSDVISAYCYGISAGSLRKPDFDKETYHSLAVSGELALLLKQCPWIFTIVNLLPHRLAAMLNSKAVVLMNKKKDIERQVKSISETEEKDLKAANSSPTIFHELINSDMPAEERTMDRLVDEGITLIGAGTLTTAHVLSRTIYYILTNTNILKRLQRELDEAMPDGFGPSAQENLVKVEHLPYLGAVIKEGFRLAHALSRRNARVAPDRSLKFGHWDIPAGSIVSMTNCILHMDPTVYPEPQEFLPERWLKDSSEGAKASEKYLLPFNRGSRICLGMNLANAELYMTLAAVLRRFELTLFETTKADVELAHDFIGGMPRLDSEGVRVVVVQKRK